MQELEGQLPSLLQEAWYRWLRRASALPPAAACGASAASYAAASAELATAGGAEAVATWPARTQQLQLAARHLCRCAPAGCAAALALSDVGSVLGAAA